MGYIVLEIKELTCDYDSKFVLHDINLKIESGEFIGVIGPNGSGKTTLLRAISRVLKPISGKIILEGKDIWKTESMELAKRIAVVSQNPPLNFMTVEEYVLLGRIPHFKRLQFLETKHDLEVVEKALKLTGTYKFKDRPIDEISGGERQLVLIARALAQEPKLLLLDEPTAYLDISHQVKILDLIKRLNEEIGLTVIIVMHDLNLASEYCERLVLIHEGRIYKVGSPQEVLEYQVIEDVYKTIVVVEKNPLSLKPFILLVSGKMRGKTVSS